MTFHWATKTRGYPDAGTAVLMAAVYPLPRTVTAVFSGLVEEHRDER